MPFDLQTLKDRLAARLPEWFERAKSASLTSTYAGFGAVAMWPLLEEVQRGNLLGTGMLLGSLTTGVFGSLIAAQLERWRNAGRLPDERAVAEWIAVEVEQNPESRNGLDELLMTLDAAGIIHAALAAADARTLSDALARELAALRALPRFQVALTGDRNVVAQAASGGVAIAGQHVTIVGNVYAGPPAQTADEALAIYRRVLAHTLGNLSLRGLDVATSDAAGDAKRMDLASVYVDLDTTTSDSTDDAKGSRAEPRLERDMKPLSALRAVARRNHVVLLGDPGSGKSTFMNHLAFCLATNPVEPDKASRVQGWPRELTGLVPIVVVLRDFSAQLSQVHTAGPRPLHDFVDQQLADQKLEFVQPFLAHALDEGRAIALLDGLDEIADPVARERTRDAVAAFVGRYSKSRHVVTCRTLSYQDKRVQLAGVESFQIAPFDRKKIHDFIQAWYGELERIGTVRNHAEAQELAGRLQVSVERADLRRLAPNPLLLTVMAVVNTHKGQLPDARALVYRDVVDLLLWRWDEIKATKGDEPILRKLVRDAGLADTDVIRILSQLAFEAQGNRQADDTDAVVDIPEATLVERLAARHPTHSLDWATQVVAAMKLRAGLLVERAPHVFSFPHRTFQEHLAGAYLSTRGGFAKEASELLDDGPYWLQTVLLGVGRLVHVAEEFDKPLALVNRLCPDSEADTERAWRKAWFAGEALVEFGVGRANADEEGRRLADRVRRRLASLIERGRLSPVERAAAGAALGRIGDPRFRSDAWFLPNDGLLGFVEIPGGPFTMGSDKKKDKQTQDDETPQHKVTLPMYYIGRWPVTVAQFKTFVDDPENDGFVPQDPDCVKGVANHPVVNVTWHEALKYSRWLTGKLRAWDETPEALRRLLQAPAGRAWQVTLASEAEWEKAARGADGRIYPWGQKADPNRANCDETGIGGTSAVGCFPGDAAYAYMVEDLSGNVWEWTRSCHEEAYPYAPDYAGRSREKLSAPDDVLRVVRGGAFSYSSRYVRAAYRLWYNPDLRHRGLGFRVVVSPFASDL